MTIKRPVQRSTPRYKTPPAGIDDFGWEDVRDEDYLVFLKALVKERDRIIAESKASKGREKGRAGGR